MNISKFIEKKFENSPDLIKKEIKLSLFKTLKIYFLETISSSDKVNDYVLKNLIQAISKKEKIIDFKNYIAGPNTSEININEVLFYISNGFTIITDNETIIAVETKADINRSVSESKTQASVVGPKDAFTENFQINVGLIKRRIKTPGLVTDEFIIGRRTKTKVGVLYFDDIADKNSVKLIKEKLSNLDIDGITDSSELAQIIDGENKSYFPTIFQSERPDSVAASLLEGKIAIVIDTTTFVLIAPSFFIDFINPINDKYTKGININFVKLLRLFCFFLSMLAPAIYIALVNFNQETIPTKILLNFAAQQEGVPFPAIIEAIIMLIICELLRESDLRFPSNYGSAISILGALILGEASVSAGIVSPIIIIVIALTFISSLIFTDIDFVNGLRHYRFLFLISAALLGLYGIILAFIYFVIKLCDTYSIDKDYSIPVSPFDLVYLKKELFKTEFKKDTKRSKNLSKTNTYKKEA